MFNRRPKNPDLSIQGIESFIQQAKQFPVSSLSVGRPGARITVYQNPAPQPAAPVVAVEDSAAREPLRQGLEKIKSNRVGVYHPVENISVGSKIKKGDAVAKIRAMKIDDEITAEKDCVIKEILVQENDLIEYGQPLFFIE